MEREALCDCDVIHEEAVAEVRPRMASAEEYARTAALLKMFGDPTRVKIMHALDLHELCVCDLAALLDLTKSAVSHQLRVLKQSNLVKNRRAGKVVYYSIADEHVETIINNGMDHVLE